MNTFITNTIDVAHSNTNIKQTHTHQTYKVKNWLPKDIVLLRLIWIRRDVVLRY